MPDVPTTVVYWHIWFTLIVLVFLQVYPILACSPLEAVETLEQLRAIWHGERIAVLLKNDVPLSSVDTLADLASVQEFFRQTVQ